MKVFITGTRGIPGIPGGVERHCEQLYPLIADKRIEIRISRRSSYVKDKIVSWQGISLVDIRTPRIKSLEAITHTFLSIIEAKKWRADLVHIHAIGPAIVSPLARLLGMKVVVTNHGPDYDRQKWGTLAKGVLKLGEFWGCKYANEVIAISDPIRKTVYQRCKRTSHLIYNGVPIPKLKDTHNYLDSLGLIKEGYIFVAARLVPEKGLDDLIVAFEHIKPGYKLVIAGDSDHKDTYSKGLKARAAENDNILMPGYVTGGDLDELYTHARLFVLPSYHEGLPIALLEALSFGLPVVVSDIPANTEVKLAQENYFPVGNVEALRMSLERALNQKNTQEQRDKRRQWIAKTYNWNNIADQTLSVYHSALQ